MRDFLVSLFFAIVVGGVAVFLLLAWFASFELPL